MERLLSRLGSLTGAVVLSALVLMVFTSLSIGEEPLTPVSTPASSALTDEPSAPSPALPTLSEATSKSVNIGALSTYGSYEQEREQGCREKSPRYGELCGWESTHWEGGKLHGVDALSPNLTKETLTCLAYAFHESSAPQTCRDLSYDAVLPLPRLAADVASCLDQVAAQYADCNELPAIASRLSEIATSHTVWTIEGNSYGNHIGAGTELRIQETPPGLLNIESLELFTDIYTNSPMIQIYNPFVGYGNRGQVWLWPGRPAIPDTYLAELAAAVHPSAQSSSSEAQLFGADRDALPRLGSDATRWVEEAGSYQRWERLSLCPELVGRYGEFCSWAASRAPDLGIDLPGDLHGVDPPDDLHVVTAPLSRETLTCLAYATVEPGAPSTCSAITRVPTRALRPTAAMVASCLDQVAQQYTGCSELPVIADNFAAIATGDRSRIWTIDPSGSRHGQLSARAVSTDGMYVNTRQFFEDISCNEPAIGLRPAIGLQGREIDSRDGWLWPQRPSIQYDLRSGFELIPHNSYDYSSCH